MGIIYSAKRNAQNSSTSSSTRQGQTNYETAIINIPETRYSQFSRQD